MQKPELRPQVVSTIWPPWFARTKQYARWPSPTTQARGHRSHATLPPSAGVQKRAGCSSAGSIPSSDVSLTLELMEVEVAPEVAVGKRLLDRGAAPERVLEVLVRDEE